MSFLRPGDRKQAAVAHLLEPDNWFIWVFATVVGFSLAASAGPLATRAGLEWAPGAAFAVMVIIGAAEGMVVGLAQGLALVHAGLHIPLWAWARSTTLASVVTWALGNLSPLTNPGQNGQTSSGLFGVMLFLGAVHGAALGFSQWLLLRNWLRKAGWWIVSYALGYLLWDAWVVAADIPANASMWPRMALGGLVALLTGAALVLLGSYTYRLYSMNPQ